MTSGTVDVRDRLKLTFCEIRQVFDERHEVAGVVRGQDNLDEVGLVPIRLTRVGRRGGSFGVDYRTFARPPRTAGRPFGVREARSKVRHVA